MKKFKNLMLMLALALFFVGAMGVTKASAEEATSIKYDLEYITITGVDGDVYYQVVKSAENTTGLKTANWVPAAEKDGTYYIDFSATANTKDAYIAWTTDNTKDTGKVITIDAKIKSLKVTLNYATEKIVNGLDDIISKVVVKGIETTDDNTDGVPAKYAFQWKRGANGTWANEGDFDQLEWDMVKASNATLYISASGNADENPAAYTYRPSKEAKVKIPKAAKAPNVKIDFAKGTVALKNGMQVREVGKDAWTNVSPYSKTEEKNTEIFSSDATVATKTKVSNVLVGDLVAALQTKVKDGEELALEVRTAATDKKFPSNIGTLKFNTPATNTALSEDMEFTYTKADKTAKIAAEFTINFQDFLNAGLGKTGYSAYEYILVKATDGKADEPDFTKQKWTKLPDDGILNLASKIDSNYKYVKADGTTVTTTYKEVGAVYVRKAADKEKSLFPSKYSSVVFTVSEAKTYTVSVKEVEGIVVTYKIGEGTALKAKKGDVVTVSYELAEGYELTSITVADAEVQPVTYADGKFTMPASNVTITASVSKKATE